MTALRWGGGGGDIPRSLASFQGLISSNNCFKKSELDWTGDKCTTGAKTTIRQDKTTVKMQNSKISAEIFSLYKSLLLRQKNKQTKKAWLSRQHKGLWQKKKKEKEENYLLTFFFCLQLGTKTFFFFFFVYTTLIHLTSLWICSAAVVYQ